MANKGPQSYEEYTRRHYQDETVARAYHAQFASGVSLTRLSHVIVAGAERRAVRNLLAAVKGPVSLVVDIPCGTGKLVPVLRDLRAIGGDISRHMMDIARAGARATAARWEFVQLDVTALPFGSASVDLAVCLRLFHRIPEEIRLAALRELGRITRRFLILSYGITSSWHRLRQNLRRLVIDSNTIPYPMTRTSAAELLRGNGWHIASRVSPLPLLSAEEIVLLTKD